MAPNSEAGTTGFQNRLFRTELVRTAGGVRILVRAARPKGRFDNRRQVAACIFDIAAELERRSDEVGALWAVLPAPSDSCIDIELGVGDDVEGAMRVAREVLADLGLA